MQRPNVPVSGVYAGPSDVEPRRTVLGAIPCASRAQEGDRDVPNWADRVRRLPRP
jgi:hypothetical protein